MKKRFFTILLCAALLSALCPAAAAAAEPEAGFYKIATAERVEIVPLAADGSAVAGASRDVDGSGETLFYPGSQKLRVTVADAVNGEQYLLTVSAGDAVLYADQKTGGAPLSFDVAFQLPEQRTDLLLDIGSNAPGFEKNTVTLCYTPSAPIRTPAPISTPRPTPAPSTPESPAEEPNPAPAVSFSDVDEGAWYCGSVRWAVANAVMNGVGEGRFLPDGTTSRAMIVTALWRMEGKPVVDYLMTFKDVPGDAWYAEAVRWATAQRIVEGCGNGAFNPDGEITREQLAAILYRCAQRKGQGFTGAWMFLLDYPDADEISSWADEAMHWCVMREIVSGKGGKLVPGGSATRAEAATMLMRFGAKV